MAQTHAVVRPSSVQWVVSEQGGVKPPQSLSAPLVRATRCVNPDGWRNDTETLECGALLGKDITHCGGTLKVLMASGIAGR